MPPNADMAAGFPREDAHRAAPGPWSRCRSVEPSAPRGRGPTPTVLQRRSAPPGELSITGCTASITGCTASITGCTASITGCTACSADITGEGAEGYRSCRKRPGYTGEFAVAVLRWRF
ncbi:hypothetical protein EYF80_042636 [Liparis tanakae]|uniref:Uncharacterized protein n=1 Tax=Liparis tanakae TaxID=230148 RepID=A0A4Z2G3L9_9TELE|nr:hypothetical protein EYF80_042636 [Liparis tanakae]